MIKYNRGSKVIIGTVFKDTSGDIAYPTSANITFSYDEASTVGCAWPLDGSVRATTTITLTTPTTVSSSAIVGEWRTTWSSAIANPGIVYWTAVPSDLTYMVNEGKFELKGNLANPVAVATTL